MLQRCWVLVSYPLAFCSRRYTSIHSKAIEQTQSKKGDCCTPTGIPIPMVLLDNKNRCTVPTTTRDDENTVASTPQCKEHCKSHIRWFLRKGWGASGQREGTLDRKINKTKLPLCTICCCVYFRENTFKKMPAVRGRQYNVQCALRFLFARVD